MSGFRDATRSGAPLEAPATAWPGGQAGAPPSGSAPISPQRQLRQRSPRTRRLADRAVRVFAWAAAWLGIAVLALILYAVVSRGLHAWSTDFFTRATPGDPMQTGGGMANAILGTVLITAFAAVLGIPLGLLAGIYLAEIGRGSRLATAVRIMANVLSGAPSIIVGIFAYALLVKPLGHYSGYAGGFALAVIMLPVMARTAEDMLVMVPNEMRESALALGAPRWKVTFGVVLRAARSGLVTGAVLALVRVSGETAPLLFTAFNSPFWTRGLGGPTANLTVTMYNFALSPYRNWQDLAWGAALLIVVAVLGVSVVARLLFARETER